MTLNKNSITSALSAVLMAILLGGSGYYFGFKTNFKSSSNSTPNSSSDKSQKPIIEATSKENPQAEKTVEKIVAKEVSGVQWIKPNQPPTCDKDHPIKGKFNKTNQYYTKTAKTYDRIVPDICFASEEFARDSAGFIKKF